MKSVWTEARRQRETPLREQTPAEVRYQGFQRLAKSGEGSKKVSLEKQRSS